MQEKVFLRSDVKATYTYSAYPIAVSLNNRSDSEKALLPWTIPVCQPGYLVFTLLRRRGKANSPLL